jgi:hypothetical protein
MKLYDGRTVREILKHNTVVYMGEEQGVRHGPRGIEETIDVVEVRSQELIAIRRPSPHVRRDGTTNAQWCDFQVSTI